MTTIQCPRCGAQVDSKRLCPNCGCDFLTIGKGLPYLALDAWRSFLTLAGLIIGGILLAAGMATYGNGNRAVGVSLLLIGACVIGLTIVKHTKWKRQQQSWNATREKAEQHPNLRDHSGSPLSIVMDLFQHPPMEIGQLVSAYSTLEKTKKPIPIALRAAVICGATLLSLGLCAVVFQGVPGSFGLSMAVLYIAISMVTAGSAWWLTRFSHTCTYVGTLGLARFDCRGEKQHITRAEVFIFRPDACLEDEVLQFFQLGFIWSKHESTRYDFRWRGPGGVQLFRIKGKHRVETTEAEVKDPEWTFGLAACAAWQGYLRHQDTLVLIERKRGAGV